MNCRSATGLDNRAHTPARFPMSYLIWQLWVQVWYWLSQEARQGVPNVVGQTRLHEVLALAQLARHASEDAFAKRCLVLPAVPVSAVAVPASAIRSIPPNIHFMANIQALPTDISEHLGHYFFVCVLRCQPDLQSQTPQACGPS